MSAEYGESIRNRADTRNVQQIARRLMLLRDVSHEFEYWLCSAFSSCLVRCLLSANPRFEFRICLFEGRAFCMPLVVSAGSLGGSSTKPQWAACSRHSCRPRSEKARWRGPFHFFGKPLFPAAAAPDCAREGKP